MMLGVNKEFSANKLNNSGYTLIELMVVIAIITVLVGAMGTSLSILTSRDAYKASKKINDALTETRTLAMSREGTWWVEFHVPNDANSDDDRMIYIKNKYKESDGTEKIENYKNYKDGIKLGNSINIKNNGAFISDGTKIEFDMSKGNVSYTDLDDDSSGVYSLEVISRHSSPSAPKVSTIKIVELTGLHFVVGE